MYHYNLLLIINNLTITNFYQGQIFDVHVGYTQTRGE